MTSHSSPNPVIDFHAHVVHPDVYARTVNHNVISGFGARPMEERPAPDSPRSPTFAKMTVPAVQLADMDARGITHAVIATTTVSQSTLFAEASLAAELDRQANEGIAAWVRAHPARFTGAFTLPLQDMDRALAELDYAISQLGLRIANLPACVGARYLGDPYFAPLWSALAAHDCVAIVHPDGIRDPAFQEFSLWNGIGQGIEETRAMASIIYSGLLDRHPSLRIVMAHAGGFLPTYIARLDRNATAHPASARNLSRLPSAYLDRFYFDTVTYDPLVIEIVARRAGWDRLVFGSDYPFGDTDPVALIDRCEMTAQQRADITYSTAASLLGLAAP